MLTQRLVISALVLLGVGTLSLTGYANAPALGPAGGPGRASSFSGGAADVDAGLPVLLATAQDMDRVQSMSSEAFAGVESTTGSAASLTPGDSASAGSSIAGQSQRNRAVLLGKARALLEKRGR